MRNNLKSDKECNLAIHTTIRADICARCCVSLHLPPKLFNTDAKTMLQLFLDFANHTGCVKFT